MREYVEFQALWITKDEILTCEEVMEDGEVMVDLNEIESFNASTIQGYTAIWMTSGNSFNVKVTYPNFKALMIKHKAKLITYEQAARQN